VPYPLARRAFGAATFLGVAILAALVGCSDDPPPKAEDSFCAAAEASKESCKQPAECDGTLTAACGRIDKALGPTTVTAAKNCLQSGVCGPASCLGRAQSGAKPTSAHQKLAENFCQFCASDVPDCEAQFYAKKSKLGGLLVLPYSAAIATAVDEACTGDKDTCRAKFATCATETIATSVSDALGDSSLADCVNAAFKREGDNPTGPGGGPIVTTCTPQNCEGCCRDDKCEKGDSTSLCGAGGSACETCAGVQACKEGQCKEPCGANNCAGCCDGDTCVKEQTPEKCGGEGAACKSCKTEGASYVCSNKQCIDGSCQATCTTGCCSAAGCQTGTAANACGTGGEGCFDCGVGRTCNGTTRSCVIDPNALWDVYISFAVVPDKDKSGAAWDFFDPPDPYVVLYSSEGASSHTGQTTVQDNNTVPFWAETPLKGVKASELMNNLSIDVWDSDTFVDSLMGGCKIPLPAAVFDGSLQSHKCPATATKVEVEIYFRINKHT
jgi:hypothetical protein